MIFGNLLIHSNWAVTRICATQKNRVEEMEGGGLYGRGLEEMWIEEERCYKKSLNNMAEVEMG